MKTSLCSLVRALQALSAVAALSLAVVTNAQVFNADFSTSLLDPNLHIDQWNGSTVIQGIADPAWSVTTGGGSMSISLAPTSSPYLSNGPDVRTNQNFSGDFSAAVTLDISANFPGGASFFMNGPNAFAGIGMGLGSINANGSITGGSPSVPTGLTKVDLQLVRVGDNVTANFRSFNSSEYIQLYSLSDPSLTGAAAFSFGNYVNPGVTTGITATFSNFSVSAIPEPSTYASILGVTVLGYAAIRRRRVAPLSS